MSINISKMIKLTIEEQLSEEWNFVYLKKGWFFFLFSPPPHWHQQSRSFRILLILFVFAILFGVSFFKWRHSAHKQQQASNKNWSRNAGKLPTTKGWCAEQKYSTPAEHLSKVVGVSGVLPEANISPFIFIFWLIFKVKLLLIGNRLDQQASQPGYQTQDWDLAKRACIHLSKKKHRRQGNNPNCQCLQQPKLAKLHPAVSDLVKPWVFLDLDNSYQQIASQANSPRDWSLSAVASGRGFGLIWRS